MRLDGAGFVFGRALINPEGPAGFVFAFRVLPTVIFVAALFAVLYHLGVMQWIVRGFAVVMAWLMGTSGAESLNVAASLFLGQTEAPLTIRPYLPRLTRSELLTVMTSGMAHVSGGRDGRVHRVRHRGPAHLDGRDHDRARRDHDVEDARARNRKARDPGHRQLGREVDRCQRARRRVARDPRRPAPGAQYRRDADLVPRPGRPGEHGSCRTWARRFKGIVGWAMAPVAYLLGVPWEDCKAIGKLLGTRTVLNELIAFKDLGALKAQHLLIDRSVVIASFALCGFANISSIGIQLGGIGALAPSAGTTWRGWACEPCWREPWPTTFRPVSRESSYDDACRFTAARPAHPSRRGRRRASRRRRPQTPRLAVVLGSGLNELADRLTDAAIVPYDRIPHFPRTTVAGHEGKVLLGKLGGVPAVVFQGRFHYYEGHDLETVTFPVRVLQQLGVSTLILTAATGGIRADLRAGNLVLLTDHLNLIGSNPLRGLE